MPFYESYAPDADISVSGNVAIEVGDGATVPAATWIALGDNLPLVPPAGPGNPWTRIAIALALLETPRWSLMIDPDNAQSATSADTRCSGVRIEAHAQTNGGAFILWMGNGPQNTEPNGRGETGFATNLAQVVTAGPWVDQAMGASVGTFKEWETADLNDLRVKFVTAATVGLGAAWVYRLSMTARMVARPYAQFDTPGNGSSVATLTPRLTWSQQNQGRAPEPQKKYFVKIFNKATVDASPSFNPETASALHQALVSSSANFADIPEGRLDYDKQYTAFVKVATDFQGTDWFGPWSLRRDFNSPSKPVVTVTAPTGTIIDTARPEIRWTWADSNGDKQAMYKVMIHERPGAAWPSTYDPESSLNEMNVRYETDFIPSSDTEHPVAVNLENTKTFRAYVKAAHTLPAYLESEWAFIEFVTGFSSPMAPTLAVTAAGDRALLLVTPATPSATTKGVTLGVGGGWISTPDNAALDHTTDFEYVFEIAMLDWTPELEAVIAGKGDFDTGDGSWIFSVMPDGKFRLRISLNGGNTIKEYISTAAPGLSAGQRRFIRFTHDNNTPGGSTTVTFSHSATNGSFVTIGSAVVVSGIENVFSGSGTLRLGARSSAGLDTWQGYFYYAEGRSSIGGTIVTSPTFTGLPLGNAQFTDAQGRVWSFMGNAEVEYKENPNADAFDIERSLDGGMTWNTFRVENRTNRRSQVKSGFEDGSTVWEIVGSSCTVVNSTDFARTGGRSLKLVKSATGSNIEVNDGLLTATNSPAVPGEDIEDGVWIYSPAVSRLAAAQIEWINSSNASLGTVDGSLVQTKVGVWTFISVRAVAPASTVKWRMKVTITAFPGSVPTGEVHYIDDAEGYLAAEKSWMTMMSENLPRVFIPFLVVDHEPPFDKLVSYRAQAKTFGLGTEISSPFSSVGSVTLHENRVWLKSIMDPRLNGTWKTMDRWLQSSKRRSRQVFEPIGRKNPIVIKGVAGSDSFSISLLILGQNIRDRLDLLLDSNHGMFVQTPKNSWWAEISGDIQEEACLWDDLHGDEDAWTMVIPFQEVDGDNATAQHSMG
jgi:hypothetical protein